MKKLGICWEGMERQFEDLLAGQALRFTPLRYLEIGVCHCETTQGAYHILKESLGSFDFDVVAVDLEDDPEPSFVIQARKDRRITRVIGESERFLPTISKPFHFVLIDGCHSERCATVDFLNVEKLSIVGTIVLFHDFQESAQGGDIQGHCQKPIGVRDAVKKLGLMDGTRPRWKRLSDLKGDPKLGGADCGVFQRI